MNTDAHHGPCQFARENISLTAAGIRQPDRHVDRYNVQLVNGPSPLSQITYWPGREVEIDSAVLQHDPDPARLARIHTQHTAAHLPMIPQSEPSVTGNDILRAPDRKYLSPP